MNGEQKLTPAHLARKAVVYLRQSSEGQVRNNVESRQLQYALANRANTLGFGEVETIDVDLGASAAVAAKRRAGFERLLGAVALGEVGLILSRELSRLLRTDKDFCQLVELCQVFGTLLGDEETIYDVSQMDDQLVLGIKATMSVVELKVLRMRLAQGKENKARRGEIYPRLPPGFVWDSPGRVVKDPDLRIQEAMQLIFTKFRETWSIRQTFKWFRDNDVSVPVSKSRQGKLAIAFQMPRLSFVQDVLHNPFYAGAYTWGRRPTHVVWQDGLLRKRQTSPLPIESARVFIRDHHEGYIDWATFEENQVMISRNNFRGHSDPTAGAARAGKGLLGGLLRCRRCGRRLHVRYWGKAGTAPRYLCGGDFAVNGGSYCVGFGGATVDRRFGEEVVRMLSPMGIRASLQALEQLGEQQNAQRQAMERQIQQLEYDATRAFEQYNEVDPRNRLVALELEGRWNAQLQALEEARDKLAALDSERRPISAAEREELMALGEDFAKAWNHPACPMELKKQIVRTLIEEVLVDETLPGKLSFIIHWKGGSHTTFEMDKPNARTASRTADADLDVIRKMAPRYGDDVIAGVLNKQGRPTWKSGSSTNPGAAESPAKAHWVRCGPEP
jgi:DNA invertase Pin-like site-specific DNA recombinase